jgi:hypothetical protein
MINNIDSKRIVATKVTFLFYEAMLHYPSRQI